MNEITPRASAILAMLQLVGAGWIFILSDFIGRRMQKFEGRENLFAVHSQWACILLVMVPFLSVWVCYRINNGQCTSWGKWFVLAMVSYGVFLFMWSHVLVASNR